MSAPIIKFPHKKLRAEVIVDYVSKTPYKGIVCITCGPAGDALKVAVKEKNIHLIVLENLPKWLSMEDIANEYPGYFDATSGHLPLWLMQRVADRFRYYFNKNPTEIPDEGYWRVPTGSGETLFELSLMGLSDTNTKSDYVALYDYNKGSKYESEAPLNNAVANFFQVHFYVKRTEDEA